MPPWPTRPDTGESYQDVPTSPSPLDPLHPPASRASLNPASAQARASYVSSPLNPNNAAPSGSRSRPVSWGASGMLDTRVTNSSGSDGSGNSSHSGRGDKEDKEALKGILSGTVGGSLGPYSPLRGSTYAPPQPPHQRFSTLSSVGSMISLDSKYPSMYVPNSNTQLSGGFFPYSDQPHIDYTNNSFTVDEDDALHEPEPKGFKDGVAPLNWRGVLNLSLVFIIVAALVALFAGYPVISYFATGEAWYGNGIGINGTGQAAFIPNVPQLIDPDTPEDAKTRVGVDGQDYELVFSDEFNVPGRSFNPGDDPFWEAVDLHYWATKDYEYYDPRQVTTEDGKLVITMDALPNHDLWYMSGMLQSWNKFCFTGGYVEVSVLFPGDENAKGYWPAAWTMGNLGRPGYGATTDGTWPYTYDECDVGTLHNQTNPLTGEMAAATGSRSGGPLSYLPGQRLSACTCPGEDHPGPSNTKGRAAPEIDIFEAEKNKLGGPGGQTSQSSQYAPFAYQWIFPEEATTVYSPERTFRNTFRGSTTQQSVSSLTQTESDAYENAPVPAYSVYGVEFSPSPKDRSKGYINWIADGRPSYGLTGAALGADTTVGIGQRMISEEPMTLVMNLGMSSSFQLVDPSTLTWPAKLRFDYIRVYQKVGQYNVGCDPPDFPTSKYIQDHLAAYDNPNATFWVTEAGYPWPKNSLTGC